MAEIKINASEIREAFQKITSSTDQERAVSVNFLNSITATDQAGLDLLISGIKMPDIDIKISSALALGRLAAQTSPAIESLQELLEDQESNTDVRLSAATALAQMNSPKGTEALACSLRKLSQTPDRGASFWSFALRTYASVGALGLPHLDLFEDLKNSFITYKMDRGSANIKIGRIELSRAIEKDFYRFVSRGHLQSPPFGAFLTEECRIPDSSESSLKLGEYKLQFDERVTFGVNKWGHDSSVSEAFTRVVILKPINESKKPLVIACHDEMTHNFFLVDAQDIAKQISKHLDAKISDFKWATYSSPTKDNTNFEGSLRIIDHKSPAMILNSLDSEFKLGSCYKEILTYLRTVPNPPTGFYQFTIEARETLARKNNRILSQGNYF